MTPTTRRPDPLRRSLRAVGAFALALTVLAAGLLPAAPAAQGAVTVIRDPYLVQPRRTQVKINWKTAASATSVVHWGTTSALGNVATGASGTHHSVLIEGLTSDTRYYYRVFSDGVNLTQTRPFRTLASRSNPSLRFAVVGDFGAATTAEVQVANRIRTYGPRMIMTTGDNAYGEGSESQLDEKVFAYYEDVIDTIGLNATMGNHDVITDGGRPSRRAFALQTTHRYSFDTANVHIVALDSTVDCVADGCPQTEWLKADLASATMPFTFVFFHHSVSSCGKHGTDESLRDAWHPIFADAGVDAVFMGHDHGYQRSVPVDGVTYITTGGGGAGLYEWELPCPEAAAFADVTTPGGANHAVIVDLSAGVARIRAVRGSDGAILDDVTITP